MNRSEIRIGNWVHHKAVWSKYNNDSNASEPLTDFDMLIEQACFYHDEECTLSIENDLEPIPLTVEWLGRFDFRKSPSGNSIFLPVPQLKAEIHFEHFRGELVCVLYCSTGSFIPNDIKYVHHLQNLFFALTGQEIQAKEI